MSKEHFYSLTNILTHNADYNVIYGERSNGKTTAVLRYGLVDHINSGYENQIGIVRRWEEDFKGKKRTTNVRKYRAFRLGRGTNKR